MTDYYDVEELPEGVEGMVLDAMQSLPSPDEPPHPAGLSDQMKAWIAMKDLAGAVQLGTKTLLVAKIRDDAEAILEARYRFETYREAKDELLTGEELKRRIRERQGPQSDKGGEPK